jgi:hypothetical protein
MNPKPPLLDDETPTTADYNRLVHFARRNTPFFQAIYLTVDDVLVFRMWSPSVANTARLSLRLMTPDGEVRPRFESFTKQTAGTTPFIAVLNGVEGFLMSATIDTPGVQRGQVYVSLEVQRGTGSGDTTFGDLLISGYPGAAYRIGYPESPPASPLDGRGNFQISTLGTPAAGVDFSQQVAAGEQWILRGLHAQLVTSAAAANRVPHFQVTDGAGNIAVDVSSLVNQAASLTFNYGAFNGGQNQSFDSLVQMPLPFELRCQPGYIIKSLTTAIQAADQWSQIIMTTERFITA